MRRHYDIYDIATNFYSRYVNGRDSWLRKGLEERGYSEDYVKEHSDEFHISIAPSVGSYSSMQLNPLSTSYAIYHNDKRLFTLETRFEYDDNDICITNIRYRIIEGENE